MKGEGKAGWILIKLLTVLVYVFMFAPILVVLVLSFNASQFGGFPMTGFSLHWYGRLFENEAVVRAFQTSLWIRLLMVESARNGSASRSRAVANAFLARAMLPRARWVWPS